MYVELIFEDGSHSVACYESEEEALSAIEANQERAKNGLPANTPAPGERQQNAVRVARALMYDKHPGDFNPEQVVSADEAKKAMTDAIKALDDDGVSVMELAAQVRELSSPIAAKEAAHDSQYKMKEKKELKVGEE